jgi:dihydrofolate synthase/folylpolyglutamate synthase
MTYQETIDYIYGLGRFGMKPGLSRITALLAALHSPQDSFATVHVAGTNGKGSTASFLAAMLAAGGHRTGLFTSPHLLNFTERIRINAHEINEDEVAAVADRVIAAAPDGTTFFELVTAMACLYFAEQGVTVAVMEAGMGGGLDATNALSGILSVITPISLDHCEWLGAELGTVAAEKAGIIKKRRPVIVACQPAAAQRVIAARCQAMESHLYREGEQFVASWEGRSLVYHGLHSTLAGLVPGIPGRYQRGNAACALAAAELLDDAGYHINEVAMGQGIEQARWPGRMELLGDAPRVLLDGAHNPAGATALAEALPDISYDRLLLVVGLMGDKDLDGILGPLLPLAAALYAVAPGLDRALPVAVVADYCRRHGVLVHEAGTVDNGLALARAAAGPGDLVLVCGSLFTVGEARGILLSKTFEAFRG